MVSDNYDIYINDIPKLLNDTNELSNDNEL